MLRRLLAVLAASAFGSSSALAGGPYFLISPVPTQTAISCWAPHFPKFGTIVGYSVLGHFFLRNDVDNEYIVLHPFKKAAKSYGTFPDTKSFETSVLKDDGFADYVLRPKHVKEVERIVGTIKQGQVYIPRPYPFTGGSDRPETYSKGDVWVFMDIVGQMHGLCG
jgi:hypothetical protein